MKIWKKIGFGVDIAMNLVVFDTSSKTEALCQCSMCESPDSCPVTRILNCQFKGQLPDAMVLLNRIDRSLNDFKNILKYLREMNRKNHL